MRILTQKDGSSVIKAALREGGADPSTLIADIEQIAIYGSGNRSMNRTAESPDIMSRGSQLASEIRRNQRSSRRT